MSQAPMDKALAGIRIIDIIESIELRS